MDSLLSLARDRVRSKAIEETTAAVFQYFIKDPLSYSLANGHASFKYSS